MFGWLSSLAILISVRNRCAEAGRAPKVGTTFSATRRPGWAVSSARKTSLIGVFDIEPSSR